MSIRHLFSPLLRRFCAGNGGGNDSEAVTAASLQYCGGDGGAEYTRTSCNKENEEQRGKNDILRSCHVSGGKT
jgi:hypothetical protein